MSLIIYYSVSVEFTLNCQVEVLYGMPWSSLCIFVGSSSFFFLFFFWWRWAGSFPLALLILQNRDSKRPTNCSVATRDCLPWNIFDLLLLNSNPPARLRMRRARGFKGSEFQPAALKLASDPATASLKILQWLLITPRKKDSSFLWLALTNFSASSHTALLFPSLSWIPLNQGSLLLQDFGHTVPSGMTTLSSHGFFCSTHSPTIRSTIISSGKPSITP